MSCTPTRALGSAAPRILSSTCQTVNRTIERESKKSILRISSVGFEIFLDSCAYWPKRRNIRLNAYAWNKTIPYEIITFLSINGIVITPSAKAVWIFQTSPCCTKLPCRSYWEENADHALPSSFLPPPPSSSTLSLVYTPSFEKSCNPLPLYCFTPISYICNVDSSRGGIFIVALYWSCGTWLMRASTSPSISVSAKARELERRSLGLAQRRRGAPAAVPEVKRWCSVVPGRMGWKYLVR